MTTAAVQGRAGRPTAEAAQIKHAAILEASFEEFARVGFRGASMRDIAAKAQISTRTLYNRYPDKAALFDACVELASQEFERIDPNHDADLRSWLLEYALALHRQLMSERSRQISLLIYREGAEFDELRQIARARFEEFQVAPVVERLALNGVIGEAGHYLAIQFVGLALAEWQRQLIFGGPLLTQDEIVLHASRATLLFLDGGLQLAKNWDASAGAVDHPFGTSDRP